jgi:hypothetical protein
MLPSLDQLRSGWHYEQSHGDWCQSKVWLREASITQTGEVHSGGSYLSQNDRRLHFGLGFAKKIDHVSKR